MLMSPSALLGSYINGLRLDEWNQYEPGITETWVLSAKLGKELKDRIDEGFTFVLTKEMVESVLTGEITSHTHEELDPVFTNSPSFGISSSNINNWNTAYGWGNHASAGYLTSITKSQVEAVLTGTITEMYENTGTNVENIGTVTQEMAQTAADKAIEEATRARDQAKEAVLDELRKTIHQSIQSE